jgi:hypothetical protein
MFDLATRILAQLFQMKAAPGTPSAQQMTKK